MRLCAFCDEPATYVLVGDADLRSSSHDACDEHEQTWGRLYRRSVRLSRELDVRDVDLTDGRRGAPYPAAGSGSVA